MNTLLIDPQYLGLIIAACCVLMTLFAAPSLPLISAVSQIIAKSQKKSFYDKFGKQITRMCVIFAGTALAITILGAVRYFTLDMSIVQGPYKLPLIIFAALTGAAAIVLAIYFSVWKSMRKQKGAHITIGLLGSVLSFVAIIFGTALAVSMQSSLHILPSVGTSAEIFIALSTIVTKSFLMHLLLAFVLGITLCGSFSLVYLLSRREKDDFGRDYYKFAAPYAAKWAIAGALLQSALTFLLFGSSYFYIFTNALSVTPTFGTAILNPSLIVWLAPQILPLLASLLWVFIIMSTTPMRRKVSMYCSTLIMIICNLCLFFIFAISILSPVTG